jgi:hypothetical protein
MRRMTNSKPMEPPPKANAKMATKARRIKLNSRNGEKK